MIVCSCNVLSDHQIRAAVSANAPRVASQIYRCLGCNAQCGRCARAIRRILDQATKCPNNCADCPHTDARHADASDHSHHSHHASDAHEELPFEVEPAAA